MGKATWKILVGQMGGLLLEVGGTRRAYDDALAKYRQAQALDGGMFAASYIASQREKAAAALAEAEAKELARIEEAVEEATAALRLVEDSPLVDDSELERVGPVRLALIREDATELEGEELAKRLRLALAGGDRGELALLHRYASRRDGLAPHVRAARAFAAGGREDAADPVDGALRAIEQALADPERVRLREAAAEVINAAGELRTTVEIASPSYRARIGEMFGSLAG